MHRARAIIASRQRPAIRNFRETRPAIPCPGPPPNRITRMREMKLQDLKSKTPTELLSFAEELEVENASTMSKQELMFAILKQLASREVDISGEGVHDVLYEGMWYMRSTLTY